MAITFRTTGSAASSGGATSLTPGVPAGTLDGDALVAVIAIGETGAITAPAGWTQVTTQANSPLRTSTYIRIAASEPASYTWSWATSVRCRAIIAGWYGESTTTPQDCVAATAAGTAAPSITTATDNAVAIAVWSTWGSTMSGYPADWTSRYVSPNVACRISIYDKLITPPGPTGNQVATAAQIGAQLALRPPVTSVSMMMQAARLRRR